MKYKGIVTSYNLKLCQFTLDDAIIVYAGHMFTSDIKISLPTLNEEVFITEGLLYDSKYIFLTEDSEIICNKYCDEAENEKCVTVVNTISNLNLGAVDLLSLTHHVDALNEMDSFTSTYFYKVLGLPDLSSEDVILKIIPHTLNSAKVVDKSIFNEVIPYIKINSPTKFKVSRNAKKLVSGAYWTYGVNYNEDNEFLVGYLHLSETLGFTVLADKNYFLVCVVVPDEVSSFSKDMQHVLNKFVLLKKYKIFTEMFKDLDIIQYVYFCVKDIRIIDFNYHGTILTNVDNCFEMELTILHRSSLICKGPQFHCLLHCNIRSQLLGKDYECLLKLRGNNLKKYPFINDGDKYKLVIPEDDTDMEIKLKNLEGEYMNDIVGMQSDLKSLTLPSNIIMLLNSEEHQDQQLLNVKEAVSLLKSGYKKLISFQGIIVQKRFIEPLPSRMKKPVKNLAFGTSGCKIHQIILKNCQNSNDADDNDDENRENLEEIYENNYVSKSKEVLAYVYLYYWEKIQSPLGLLPDMRVAIRYFYPQNGSYFKPTSLSIIQPLQYEPVFLFNTCYELQDNYNWGPMCYLGNGEGVPTDCVCWGPTETLRIANLTIHHTCTICDAKISENQIQCCGNTNYELNMMLVMTIRDKSGNADVLTKNHDVFRILMDYNDEQWTLFKEAMKKVACFVYSPTQDDIEFNVSGKFIRFIKLLYLQINIWNLTEIHTLDLKCRKLDKSYRDAPFTPKWYCIEARKTEIKQS